MKIIPWLHFLGAVIIVILFALFSAVHSELGGEISVGESQGFAWVRANITVCIWLGLVYLILVGWLQHRQTRYSSSASYRRLLQIFVWLEIMSIAASALVFYYQRFNLLPIVHSVLVLAILSQGVLTFWGWVIIHVDLTDVEFQKSETNAGLFLILLFLIGAAIGYLEPSWRRLTDQVALDSEFECLLRYGYPPILSGITNVWFGIGMLAVIHGISYLRSKFGKLQGLKNLFYFFTFFFMLAFFGAILLGTLFYAVSWQICKLHQQSTVLLLFFLLSIGGSVLSTAAFFRIGSQAPQARTASLVGIVSLTFGAAILLPLTWLLTLKRTTKATWLMLLLSIFSASVMVGYLVLFGEIFNPWFTSFSFLKGAILKFASVVAAGATVLMLEALFDFKPKDLSRRFRPVMVLALTAFFSCLPFYVLGYYPEVKSATLQFNELTRVDATFARELVNTLGLDSWIRLGQSPSQNGNSHPWPQPWKLKKTQPSNLPENFNLLVIVVDALRGDAFHSAGYPRNLTPFLDRWAREETISFRRAYSQGGGSFAAFPFLVAGRSNFELYGPELHRENLYLKIAQAEGIEHFMVMRGFGPRHVYPPNYPVIELAIPRALSDRRSATADEVFYSASNAIGRLSKDDRFLCFLHLMDVHNELWKKSDGLDFGNQPRDLYDNNLSYIDNAFKRFVKWLKHERIYDRTVIIFTSDHGEQFGEHGASLHGHTLYEEEIRIPLISLVHGMKGRFEDIPVIAADMAPTIAELAGYSITPPYDDSRMGISLVPLIRRNKEEPYLERDVVGRASFKRRYFLYRNWEWKFIYFAELDLLQLYNVVDDPLEKNNLIQEEPVLAAEMEKDLLDYLEKVEGKTYRSLLSD